MMKMRIFTVTRGPRNSTSVNKLFLLLVIVFLSSCASTSHLGRPPEQGSSYVNASWYGQKYHGRLTASGAEFDMYAMTCAHRTLEFGTKLRITNPDNNKTVIVTVNDRGPFIRGRDLDLSYAAAKKIGMVRKGVGRVKMELVQ